MDLWITFWTVIILLGIGAFVVLVVIVIPLGGKDVLELLRRLGRNAKR
ncbi:MAG TPA: hypothetical protein VMO47_18350 [Rhodothermales bacterium]|nr:hypothetical protein [Rhodothermales bacterium]